MQVAPAYRKGIPLWHTALLAKCSVLYLLSRLMGKMRVRRMETLVLPGRKTDRFLRMGMSKNLSRFREWKQGYMC